MTTTNLYYYNPKTLDLAKIKGHAIAVATGTHSTFNTNPEMAVLHFHDHDNPCRGVKHLRYHPKEKDQEQVNIEEFFPESEVVMH